MITSDICSTKSYKITVCQWLLQALCVYAQCICFQLWQLVNCKNVHSVIVHLIVVMCTYLYTDYDTVLYLSVYVGLYITFYLLGIGSYALATMPYSGLLADMTHPSLRGDPNVSNYRMHGNFCSM